MLRRESGWASSQSQFMVEGYFNNIDDHSTRVVELQILRIAQRCRGEFNVFSTGYPYPDYARSAWR